MLIYKKIIFWYRTMKYLENMIKFEYNTFDSTQARNVQYFNFSIIYNGLENLLNIV